MTFVFPLLHRVTLIDHKGGTKPFCANVGLPAWLGVFYYQGIVVIQYFFPLVIITGAYAHMGFKLWGATAPGNKEESRDAVVLRNKKKVNKIPSVPVSVNIHLPYCFLPHKVNLCYMRYYIHTCSFASTLYSIHTIHSHS